MCLFWASIDTGFDNVTGAKGLSCFLVPADTEGLTVEERIDVIAPHPLARLAFTDMRLPANALIGKSGKGFGIAMSVLDVFRSLSARQLWTCARAAEALLVYQRFLFGAMTRCCPGKPCRDGARRRLDLPAAWTKDAGAAISASISRDRNSTESHRQGLQLHGGDASGHRLRAG